MIIYSLLHCISNSISFNSSKQENDQFQVGNLLAELNSNPRNRDMFEQRAVKQSRKINAMVVHEYSPFSLKLITFSSMICFWIQISILGNNPLVLRHFVLITDLYSRVIGGLAARNRFRAGTQSFCQVFELVYVPGDPDSSHY